MRPQIDAMASPPCIVSGLWPGQVLQRTPRGVSAARIEGIGGREGPVRVRVEREGRRGPLRGFASRVIGGCHRGRWAATLKGVPAGGPYVITLVFGAKASRADSLTIRDVCVGDVWLLGGQSNMQGCGQRADALPPHPAVRACFLDDRWRVAQDPLHNWWHSVDAVHGGQAGATDDGLRGVGPGVSFGQAMHALTGVPQGLIACAHGGTRMDQWSPRLKRAGGHSLYGAMLRRHHRNGGHIAGLLWHQGESDAGLRSMLTYAGKMRAFVRAVRRDFGNPVLPIVVAQLGRFAGPQEQPVAWNTIREIQRRLPEQFPRLAVVPTIDLRMCDPVHLSGEAQHQLGQRLAGAMFALRGRRAGSASIALRSVRVRVPSSVSQATVEVAFTHVVGGLQSAVRPAGFSLYDADQLYAVIHDVELAGGVVRLRTCRPAADLIGKTLYYGAGLDPVCTITDGAGRPLPAMGPLTLHAGRSA